MSVITATFDFTPAVPGITPSAPVRVSGESLTELKQKTADVLAAKRATAASQAAAIDAAYVAINS